MRIFHIATHSAWERAGALYSCDTLRSEGFIHCCTAHQITTVLNARFRGVQDLILLEVEPANVSSAIQYENLEGGDELFPHIYGPLNRDAVVAVHPLNAERSGEFMSRDSRPPQASGLE